MASTFRKALGAIKDRTSIGLAKVSSDMASDLNVTVIKATSHDNNRAANEGHIRMILDLTSNSRSHASACIATVSKRLGKTNDWVVALKALMLLHRLLIDGNPALQHEIFSATRRRSPLLNMVDFRDKAHSNSWDHSAFIRTYALYLDKCLECMVYERRRGGDSNHSNELTMECHKSSPFNQHEYGDMIYANWKYDRSLYSPPRGNGRARHDEEQDEGDKKPLTALRNMKLEKVLIWLRQLQQLLSRFLACRPTGYAKHCKMILVALYPTVKESFQLYADISQILVVLQDRFFDMDYSDCVRLFHVYTSAAKQINELDDFYAWLKHSGVVRSSEYPEVQCITEKRLKTLEEFIRDKARKLKSPLRNVVPASTVANEEPYQRLSNIKDLLVPSDYKKKEPESTKVTVEPIKQRQANLLDTRDDGMTVANQSNKLTLALFQGPMAKNGAWDSIVASAWQYPAVEIRKANREIVPVETASNLSNQKVGLGGGLNPLLLSNMYDQGTMRQQVNSQVNGENASSMTLAIPKREGALVLTLAALDGSMQMIRQDPFVASRSTPPPSYVQMADR